MDKFGHNIKGFTDGALEGLGLGRMTPFVKMGHDEMTGDRQALVQDIVSKIDKFGPEVLARASKLPPLGNFQTRSDEVTPLTPARLSELLREFNGIIGKAGGPSNDNGFDGLRKVFGTVNLLYSTFNDYKQFTKRAAGSVYSNLRM